MKRILSLILSLVMIVGIMTVMPASVVNAAEGEFSDVKAGAWYEETLNIMIDQNIIAGYPDGTFKGTNEMTRDQFIKTMVVAIAGEQPLGDSYWASEYINKAIELGVIKKGQFDTYTVKITRGEMAAIAENTLKALKVTYTYKYEKDIKNELGDLSQVLDNPYSDAIIHMYEQGVLKGYPDGKYKADVGLKRQEAITVIRRVIDKSYRVAFVPSAQPSKYPKEVQNWVDMFGVEPYTLGESNVVLDPADVVGEEPRGFGIGFNYTQTDKWSSRGEVDVTFSVSLDTVYESENPVERMKYIKYQLKPLMMEYGHFTEEMIAQIFERLDYRYKVYADYRISLDKREELNIVDLPSPLVIKDKYGRTMTENQLIRISSEQYFEMRGWYK